MQIDIQRKSLLCHVMLVACMLSLLIITTVANTMITRASSIPGGNVSDPVVRAVDIARPAIVRIITSISGHLDVQFSAGQTVTFPQNGQPYQLQLSGTGTFITSNGDILTADHVVSPPPSVLQDAASQDVANYISQHPNTGIQTAPATQIDQALNAGQLKSTSHYDQKSSEVFLSTDYTGPLTATTLSAIPATMHATVDKIEKESPFNQMDVAVVHAPFQDTPSIQLADSSNVQTQDALTIIGYPGNADVNALPQNLFTSSVNAITVSSIKTTQSGAPLIQVAGNVEHGDSGGPGLDSQGNVVGIVSFGLSSANSPGSTSFLQASNSARTLITALHLNTTQGTFEKLWEKAFADYSMTVTGHWHTAQQELQQLATGYPQFKAIIPYLTYAQNQAKTENGVSSAPGSTNSAATSSHAPTTSIKALALTIGGIAVIVLLALALFFVIIRRRKKKAPASPIGQQSQNSQPGHPMTPPTIGPITPMVNPSTPPSGVVPMQRQVGSTPSLVGQPVAGGFPQGSGAQNTSSQETLRPWPCGHMNRSNARFCSVCGELAPQPPTGRRVEQ